MENKNSLSVRRFSPLNFSEKLIYSEAARRDDFAMMRYLDIISVARIFGVPERVISGEPSYSSGKMDVANFE